MARPYPEYEGTRLWRAVEGALHELEANGELTIATAPAYVIGYLCHELAARDVIGPAALAERGGESPARPPGAGAGRRGNRDPSGGS